MGYTFVNIPYGSLAAVMTQDAAERSSLSVSRGLGGMFGNILPRIIVPLFLARYASNEARGYLYATLIFGVVALISYLVSYFTVEENVAPKAEEAQKPIKILDGFKVLFKNRAFIAVSIASISMIIGQMTNQAMSVYYFKQNIQSIELLALTGITGILPLLIIAPFLSKIVDKIGVKKTVTMSSLISAISFGAMMLFPDNAYIYIGITFAGMVGLAVPNILVWGMVADSIDYNQYLCGQRQEGSIYGSYSLVRKTGQALAGFIGGHGLAIVAYDPEAAKQTAATLFGIKFLTVGLPAIGMFIAFLVFKYVWNLTPEKKAEVIKTINKNC